MPSESPSWRSGTSAPDAGSVNGCARTSPSACISIPSSQRMPPQAREPSHERCRLRARIEGRHAPALRKPRLRAGCDRGGGAGLCPPPPSESAERLSRGLPEVDGVFVQMEDEIASIAAVIGASMGGVKAMTATSGPGFSLKQGKLGYAAGAEIPCVIVNVMRGGPSTGMPTRPAQGDIMQARRGSHGDYPIIALAPASVHEIYTETIRAFDLAELLRTPVVVLYDQVIAQLTETVELADVDVQGAARVHRKG